MNERVSAVNNTRSFQHLSQNNGCSRGDHANSVNDDREFISNGVKRDSSTTFNSQGDAGGNAQSVTSSTGRGRVSFSEPSSNDKTNKSSQFNKREGDETHNAKQQRAENQHTVEEQPEQGVGGLTGKQHYGKIDLKNV